MNKLSNLKAIGIAMLFLSSLICLQLWAKQQPKMLNFTLSVERTETVLKALSKLPYEESAPVIQDIQQQAYPQLSTPPPAPDTTGKKKGDVPKNKKQ